MTITTTSSTPHSPPPSTSLLTPLRSILVATTYLLWCTRRTLRAAQELPPPLALPTSLVHPPLLWSSCDLHQRIQYIIIYHAQRMPLQTAHRRSTNLPCATLNADICRTKYIVGCSFNFVQTIRNNFYRSSKSNASKYFARQQGVWNILSAIWFLAMPPAEAQWIDTAFRSWWRSRRHSSSSGLGCY